MQTARLIGTTDQKHQRVKRRAGSDYSRPGLVGLPVLLCTDQGIFRQKLEYGWFWKFVHNCLRQSRIPSRHKINPRRKNSLSLRQFFFVFRINFILFGGTQREKGNQNQSPKNVNKQSNRLTICCSEVPIKTNLNPIPVLSFDVWRGLSDAVFRISTNLVDWKVGAIELLLFL